MNDETIYLFDGFTLDLGRGCVIRAGKPVHLRPQTYEVLKYLVENKGHLISKDKLIEEVWQRRAVTDGSLGKCIEEVREALGADARLYIRNVRGRGYIFDPQVYEHEDGERLSGQIDVGLPLDDAEETKTLIPKGHEDNGDQRWNADHVVAEIKRRKRVALLVSATLVIATALAIFAYSNYYAGRSQAITSLAVLPFANASGDPEMEYLSDGIGENLINNLSQLPQLKVIARSSSFKYKGKEVNPQEVARALGVEAILTGRVVQRGANLVVNAELVDARKGTQLWGEQYSRQAADIQEVQKEIARAISQKMRLRLSGAQEQQLTRFATQNPEAYQAYLNGSFTFRKGGFENVRRALEYYNQAVTLDPSFAIAWVGIAKAYRDFAAKSLLDPKVALTRAKAAAQKALELDEMLPDAHAALARLQKDEWNWAEAERGYKRAIELNPNMAEAHSGYSQYLSTIGRHTEALAEGKRAQELDPLQTRGWGALYAARRYDEAIEKLQLSIKLEPDIGISHGVLALTYDAKGMHEQAVSEYQKWISIDGETTSILCYLGHALAMSGKRTEAEAILNKLKSTKEYVSPAELAVLYIGLGDKEGALSTLEKGYEARDTLLQSLKPDPLYDPLRSEQRFQDLITKMGLPQ